MEGGLPLLVLDVGVADAEAPCESVGLGVAVGVDVPVGDCVGVGVLVGELRGVFEFVPESEPMRQKDDEGLDDGLTQKEGEAPGETATRRKAPWGCDVSCTSR